MAENYFKNPLTKIIILSFVLAIGFLLIILAGALYKNWSVLVTALLFLVAHLPILISNQWSSDDFISEGKQNVVDFGRWLSAFLAISGLGLPLILNHSNLITSTGSTMAIIGGLLIYGTVVTFTTFFDRDEELAGFDI
ncbi:hypothetical protein WICMUC_003151 [Wickerhamomyces mucosus]|uniref:Vacuolar protein sorting-associated protein 55 n=1 Tax=Wickerhamomyces mucosus TaxID=1378264 RepID=A0A9P8PN80_9ASCO|nr:hypothetical protein WICMUC_003151 [Wickerhamomyces mucosus]